MGKVVEYEPYADGVEVRRGSGKPLLFVLSQEDRRFGEIFARLLREA